MCAWPRRSETGASAVELALVLPLVLVLMFGTVQYSLYFWGRQTAAASAREAARRMAVGTAWTCTQTEALGRSDRAGRDVVVAMHYENSTNAAVLGTYVEVTVSLSTVAPAVLPMPDHGVITEIAQSRVHNIPAQPLDCL